MDGIGPVRARRIVAAWAEQQWYACRSRLVLVRIEPWPSRDNST
jgi:hypothetical protein